MNWGVTSNRQRKRFNQEGRVFVRVMFFGETLAGRGEVQWMEGEKDQVISQRIGTNQLDARSHGGKW